ncbi:MAG: competence protein ComK [Solobacterium sp.]|nr:competence protein ComK [Solobacterium sp.]MBQ1446331.1 competence protein ComK [Solobacterium sp.]MBR2726862.1 competence protein ComK [Solobacterium sp.]
MRNRLTLKSVRFDRERQMTVCLFEREEVYFRAAPLQLIDHWCRMFGSTAEGRQDAFRTLTGAVQKPAILVSDAGPLLMPTAGANAEDCVWINHDLYLDCRSRNGKTEIRFTDGDILYADVDPRVIRSQDARCREFRRQIREAMDDPEAFRTEEDYAV